MTLIPYDLEKHAFACVHEETTIPPGTPFKTSDSDAFRRIYFAPRRVWKVASRTHAAKGQRTCTLGEEADIVRQLRDVAAVPSLLGREGGPSIEATIYDRVEAAPLHEINQGASAGAAVLGRLARTLMQISWRGVAHNDVKPDNVLVGADGATYLIDFDQSINCTRLAALARNFVGLELGSADIVHGSFASIALRQAQLSLPPRFVRLLHRTVRRVRDTRRSSGTPKSSADAALLDAWDIAARSDSNAPGASIAYYSLDWPGLTLEGERSWQERWAYLSTVVELRGRRVLELGCNMGLLSTWALAEAGAAAALGVDNSPDILRAAELVAAARGVQPEFEIIDFDAAGRWEDRLETYAPDIVFALNVLHWVEDKARLVDFLARCPLVVFEGHDDFVSEMRRFRDAGFRSIEPLGRSERLRPVLLLER